MALAATQTPDAPDYRNRLVFDTIRHQLPVIVIVGVLGLLAGFAFSLIHPPVYTSSASVLINPLEGNPYSPDSQGDSLVALETEAQIVSSDEVTKETAALLKDGSTLDELQKGVSALVQPNTQIIQISFTSKSATFAQRAAQAYADSYLEYRRQRSNDVNDAAIRSLKQQSKDVRGQLNAVEDRIDGLPAGPERDFQSGLRDTYRARLIELDSQVAQLTSGIAEAGRAISPAAEPKSPSGVGSIVYAAGGLLAGLLGGFVLALARERRSDHMYRPEDVDAAGVPVLARLSSHKSVVDAESREAIRRIRAAVVGSPRPAQHRRGHLLFAACRPRTRGRSPAVGLALEGRQQRRPGQRGRQRAQPRPGYSRMPPARDSPTLCSTARWMRPGCSSRSIPPCGCSPADGMATKPLSTFCPSSSPRSCSSSTWTPNTSSCGHRRSPRAVGRRRVDLRGNRAPGDARQDHLQRARRGHGNDTTGTRQASRCGHRSRRTSGAPRLQAIEADQELGRTEGEEADARTVGRAERESDLADRTSRR